MANCAACQHWNRTSVETEDGQCRARAPIPVDTNTGDYPSRWPKTRASDWCGEFSKANASVAKAHPPIPLAEDKGEGERDTAQRVTRQTNQGRASRKRRNG